MGAAAGLDPGSPRVRGGGSQESRSIVTTREQQAAPSPVSKEREAAGNPYLAAALAWAIPGLGHLYLGRRLLGLIFCLLISFTLFMGFYLDGHLNETVSDQPLTTLATLACSGMGTPYFVAVFIVGYAGDVTSPGYEYGSAFLRTAGLMNLLLILDAWDIGRGRKD